MTLGAPGLGAGCLLQVITTSLQAVLPAQAIIAITTILMPPSIAAVSVGLVGHGPSLNRWAATEYIRYQADSGKFYTLRAALKVFAAPANEFPIQDVFAIKHDVVPSDGADLFQ